ncbi:MAG: glycosyltransferase family 2 protein [Bacteroidetes bacterium]|nr:glycosyltransferase family 2 protein [Bacteroidota bacterium]
MKVSGFTFIRNALKYDYPIVEAITSILPICDEFVVAVGKSEDATLQLIQNIGSPKIKIIETIWNERLREGGRVLADETNKAFNAVSTDSDWAFYIQGDEVIHEKYLPAIRQAMLDNALDTRVEGLLFDYTHFYGSYDYIANSRKWYRHEVRIIRKDPEIYSFRDAQGFQKYNRPLRVKKCNASVYHYGWVKPPELQQAKQESFHKMWHDDDWVQKNIPKAATFDYSKIDSLTSFKGTHPNVMLPRINSKNWHFSFDPTKGIKPAFRYRLLNYIQNKTGWKIGEYRNYRLLK